METGVASGASGSADTSADASGASGDGAPVSSTISAASIAIVAFTDSTDQVPPSSTVPGASPCSIPTTPGVASSKIKGEERGGGILRRRL